MTPRNALVDLLLMSPFVICLGAGMWWAKYYWTPKMLLVVIPMMLIAYAVGSRKPSLRGIVDFGITAAFLFIIGALIDESIWWSK